MSDKLPYMPSYGLIPRVLEKIRTAATPDRFTGDFLSTKLGFKGGRPKPIIPFLKRIGFLGTDGSPTDLYRRFRNPSQSGAAAAQALRSGYRVLYEMNESVHSLSDAELKGLVVQATGSEPNSSTVKAILGSFKALKGFAKFDGGAEVERDEEVEGTEDESAEDRGTDTGERGEVPFGLSYTINLNLPATSDIAVFNAIFKSLREHLLR